MIAAAAALGIGVAAVARWGGARRLDIAISGSAGPAVVAAAYLIAGAGGGPAQLEPYRAALIAVGVGLVASFVVAIPAPRQRPGAGSGAKAKQQAEYESMAPNADEHESGEPAGQTEPHSRQPLLDETYEPGTYPEEPVAGQPRHRDDRDDDPDRDQYRQRSRAAAANSGPRPPAIMGQPPVGSYEKDYSEWLRDLGHAPGQRGDREDQRL
jgi:hypothetical protein